MLRILYICTPSSAHDLKWMRYFSEKEGEFKVYAITHSSVDISEMDIDRLTKHNIVYLGRPLKYTIWNILSSFKSLKLLEKYIREYKIDIVHALFATPYSLWIGYLSCTSFITSRGSDVNIVLPGLLRSKGTRRFYFRLLFKRFRLSFQRASYLTVTSSSQSRSIQRLFGITDVKLIRTGIDVYKVIAVNNISFIDSRIGRRKFILSPRFMSLIYNISYQIDAIELLNATTVKEYMFVFIRGIQYDKTYYEVQLDRLNALKFKRGISFIIIEYLTDEELWMHLKRAALVMMTPISDGTPNTALETMAARTPLILSDIGYDADLFDETCVKIPLNNPLMFAHILEEVLKKNNTEMVDQAFLRVQKLGNRETEMKKLEELYINSTNKNNAML